jgi:hypothetical protein
MKRQKGKAAMSEEDCALVLGFIKAKGAVSYAQLREQFPDFGFATGGGAQWLKKSLAEKVLSRRWTYSKDTVPWAMPWFALAGAHLAWRDLDDRLASQGLRGIALSRPGAEKQAQASCANVSRAQERAAAVLALRAGVNAMCRLGGGARK